LGLKEPNPIEIIENHIINEFEKENDTSIKEKGIASKFIAYLIFIKENFNSYPLGKIERLQKAVWIKTDNYDDGIFKRTSDLYLSSKYGNRCKLESLFETGSGAFVSDCYLGSVELADEQIEEWKGFFITLGVNESVKIKLENFKLNLNNSDQKNYFDNLNRVCSYQLIVDERCVSNKIHEFSDWVLDPKIEEIMISKDLAKISLLLKIFDDFWDEKYKKCKEMNHKYKRYSQKYYRSHVVSSSFIHLLKQINVPKIF